MYGGIVTKSKSIVIALISIVIVTSIQPVVSGQDIIKSIRDLDYITEQFPPFNFQNEGLLTGISVDLLDRMLSHFDLNLNRSEIVLTAWDTGYNKALKENNTVLFSTTRLPQRESMFSWVGPICPIKVAFFAMKDRNLTINSSSDLKRYKIGVIRDSAEQIILTDMGVNILDLVIENNSYMLIKSLEDGTIDIWAYGDIPGVWLLNNFGMNSNEYNVVYDLENESELYYAFNKNTSTTVVNAFQQALDKTKREKDLDGISDYEKILYKYIPVRYSKHEFTDEQVTGLVNYTSACIEQDVSGTFKKISAGEHPFKDKDDPALYVFVFDTEINLVANADNPGLVGMNFMGKTDVSGKRFRDEIVAGAINYKHGWVEYIYSNPSESGLYYKATYYKLARGSDGKLYIVCSGKYKENK